MRTLAAALIAAGILIVVDDHYNDGRYTQVLEQAVTSLLRPDVVTLRAPPRS
jgi:hypothetical protein